MHQLEIWKALCSTDKQIFAIKETIKKCSPIDQKLSSCGKQYQVIVVEF